MCFYFDSHHTQFSKVNGGKWYISETKWYVNIDILWEASAQGVFLFFNK